MDVKRVKFWGEVQLRLAFLSDVRAEKGCARARVETCFQTRPYGQETFSFCRYHVRFAGPISGAGGADHAAGEVSEEADQDSRQQVPTATADIVRRSIPDRAGSVFVGMGQ